MSEAFRPSEHICECGEALSLHHSAGMSCPSSPSGTYRPNAETVARFPAQYEDTLAWWEHVKATPIGMVPCLINGHVFAWRSAMGTDFTERTILDYFHGVPREFWPEWIAGLHLL